MRKMTRVLIPGFAAALGLVVMAGCETGMTARGTAYELNFNREMQANISQSHTNVHKAALKELGEMGITIDEQALDAFQGMIKARTASGDTVKIQSHRKFADATTIEIRVGSWGDEARSRQILEGIENRLGVPKSGGMATAQQKQPASR